MKLNLEIELDWIDDEMNLDDTVKQNVINTVVAKIQKSVTEQVESKINSLIDETVVAKISEKTDAVFNDFMQRPVTISDRYGDAVEVYTNMYDVIKKRFDNFMTEKVDKNGKVTTSNYDSKGTRLEFIIDGRLTKFADEFTTNAVKQVSEEIREHVKEGLTNKLGTELMKVLKVDNMLKLNS